MTYDFYVFTDITLVDATDSHVKVGRYFTQADAPLFAWQHLQSYAERMQMCIYEASCNGPVNEHGQPEVVIASGGEDE